MGLLSLIAITLLLSLDLVRGHSVIVYPGYRGNNLHTNGTVEGTNGLGAAYENGSYVYPYGMEWIYPCTSPILLNKNTQYILINAGGGMPTSTNRTKWPIGGGAVSFQPGWFPGHSSAFIYINMGLGTVPPNMSHPVVKPFAISGPTNEPYPGTVCLPQVPLPADVDVKIGDHATIQVIETAQHGAALYNVCFFLFVWFGLVGEWLMCAVRGYRIRGSERCCRSYQGELL